jgi:hypothetical protein
MVRFHTQRMNSPLRTSGCILTIGSDLIKDKNFSSSTSRSARGPDILAVANVLLLLVSLEFIFSTEEPINKNMLIIDTGNSQLKENHIQSLLQVASSFQYRDYHNHREPSPRYNHLDIYQSICSMNVTNFEVLRFSSTIIRIRQGND